jgi:hypothetical protein
MTDDRTPNEELARRLVRVSDLTEQQAMSLLQRLDPDDAASWAAVTGYLDRKEAGQECKLQWLTKDGQHVWARLAEGG